MTLRLSPEELNAVRALRDNQEQADADGVFVKVPRQAVDEVLDIFFSREKQMAKDAAETSPGPALFERIKSGAKERPRLTVVGPESHETVAAAEPPTARTIVRKFAEEIDRELADIQSREQTPIRREFYRLLEALRDLALTMLGGGTFDQITLEAAATEAEKYAGAGNSVAKKIATAIRRLNKTAPKTET